MTLAQTKEELQCRTNNRLHLSKATLSRRLKSAGVKSYVPVKKPLLTKLQQMKRYSWAMRYRHWTEADWKKVIFSDESMFRTYNHRRTQKIRRRKHEKYNPDCINYCVKNPLGVLVWGAISSKGVSQLKLVKGNLNSERYQREIICDIKMQCECLMFPQKNYIFQQDNAPCHNSQSTRNFLSREGVTVLSWPLNSPDLSPIENVWAIVKKRIGRLPTSKAELWTNVQNIWYNINKKDIECLFESMPRRIEAVIKGKGAITKY